MFNPLYKNVRCLASIAYFQFGKEPLELNTILSFKNDGSFLVNNLNF